MPVLTRLQLVLFCCAGLIRTEQAGCAPTGRPGEPVLPLVPQLVLGESQAQLQSLILLPVERDLHQVVVHRVLEQLGDLAHGGAHQAVHHGGQMRLERLHRVRHGALRTSTARNKYMHTILTILH